MASACRCQEETFISERNSYFMCKGNLECHVHICASEDESGEIADQLRAVEEDTHITYSYQCFFSLWLQSSKVFSLKESLHEGAAG